MKNKLAALTVSQLNVIKGAKAEKIQYIEDNPLTNHTEGQAALDEVARLLQRDIDAIDAELAKR